MTLTLEQLIACTGATERAASAWLEPLSAAMDIFSIGTPLRITAFLANVGHETMRLTRAREIWGPTWAQLRYEGRRDLGNVRPGDGRKYMGRGPLQVTGRANYIAVRDKLREIVGAVPDFEASPELLEVPRWGALAAGLYWQTHNLNKWADAGDFDGVCDGINRGHKTAEEGDSNGYAERLGLYIAGRAAYNL